MSFPIHQFVTTDSTTHNIVQSKYFNYFHLIHGIAIGGGSVIRTFDTCGRLIDKRITKATRGWLRDGNNRYYLKEIFYDTLGHKTKIYKRIRQNYGPSATTVFEKTIRKRSGR